MATNESVTATPAYSDTVLDEIEGRSVKFLSAVGRTALIRARLAELGYTAAEHAEGWRLVHAAANFVPASQEAPVDPRIAQAARELDALDEGLVTRVRSALTRKFPTLVDAALKNVQPVDGPEASQTVANLLSNLDALEKTSEGKPAIKLLAERGIDATERTRLSKLVATAQSLTTQVPDEDDGKRRAALSNLKAWFDDWAETARTNIKRRDLLIRMGLAQPRESKKQEPAPA